MGKHRFSLVIQIIAIIATFTTSCSTQRNFSFKEDFDSFYQKFHSDSAFQYSRLRFPLQGQKIDGDENQKWNNNNWNILTIPVFIADTSVFKVEYNKTEKTFTQKSWIESSGFGVEYRFELIRRKWYLVYALEVNL